VREGAMIGDRSWAGDAARARMAPRVIFVPEEAPMNRRRLALHAATLAIALSAGCGQQAATRRPGTPDSSGVPSGVRVDGTGTARVDLPQAPRPVPDAVDLPAVLGSCKADADCVTVAADCCGCSAGGKATAVARSEQAAYEAAQRPRCAALACVAMMSNDPSCMAEPRCVLGRCRLGR
jgi:hypothetical protein